MNIWLVTTGEILPVGTKEKKLRVALLADALVNNGHNVLWWTSAFNHFTKDWVFKRDTTVDVNERYKIFALKGTGYKKNISISRFLDHRIVARKFKKLAPYKPVPDIIVASMPPHDLAYEAVMFSKKNNIPVLVDIRDPWPDIFLNHISGKLQWLLKVVLNKDFKMIKETMRMADGLIAATNTFLEWGLQYAEREKSLTDRLFYLGYKKLPVNGTAKSTERFLSVVENIKSKFIIFFVGAITNSYHNPSILVKIAAKLNGRSDIHFVIAGDGEAFEDLRRASKGLINVTLTGWLNKDEIEFWLRHSNVGVCPVSKDIDLPTNKAYSYLSAGLPIISAFRGDLKEIIDKYKIGFYYPPNDVDALVECIMKLYNDPILYKKMSENAKGVFKEMFDADKIYGEYVEHIEKIVLKGEI